MATVDKDTLVVHGGQTAGDALHSLLSDLFEEVRHECSGSVADYIPQLAQADPALFGVAFCDVHGRISAVGDSRATYCLQSTSKPLNYCLARNLQAAGRGAPVHEHVGFEPSGRAFNEFCLNAQGLPHNPLINAGAIIVASLIEPAKEPAARFDEVIGFYRRLSGGGAGNIGFDNGVFLSEKHHADRNVALAYHMRQHGAFDGYPTPSQLQDHLDLYFQTCSVTINSEVGAVMAATLANHGTCPTSGEAVVSPYIVKDALSIMHGCGMYDFSGQFGFTVGLPAKSGVSGAVMLVVPGVGGFCIYSPRLDEHGNSVRGLAFCNAFARLTASRYHVFGRVLSEPASPSWRWDAGKEAARDGEREGGHGSDNGAAPRTVAVVADGDAADEDKQVELLVHRLVHAASLGNLHALRERPTLLGHGDRDGRTPLHLACAKGHTDCVVYLLSIENVRREPKDRWGTTPAAEAAKYHAKLYEQQAAGDDGLEVRMQEWEAVRSMLAEAPAEKRKQRRHSS